MADFYRKRKVKPGPSKNEQKVMRSRESEAANRSTPTLKSLYPPVDRLTIHLEFRSPQKAPLGNETRVFNANDPCRFTAPCPGTCGVGSFNLAAKIGKVVETAAAASEGTGVCQEQGGAAGVCGCELKVRMEVVYAPLPNPLP